MHPDPYKKHLTLSSSVLEELAIKHFEQISGCKVTETTWIADDDFGFAGFRIYFDSKKDGDK